MLNKRKPIMRKLILYITISTVVLGFVLNIQPRTSKVTGKEIQTQKTKLAKSMIVEEIAKEYVPEKPPEPAGGVFDNDAKMFIYNKESGNRPQARNAGGCLGLGQACPGSKLLAVCADINDYACQDAFFTKYAMSRYGSWENAKAFWLAHNWW